MRTTRSRSPSTSCSSTTRRRASGRLSRPTSYNGSADYEHRFSGFLATNTADETDRFVTEYVADGEPIASDRAYNAGVLSRYAGPFGSDAESTLLDDGFDGFEDGADS